MEENKFSEDIDLTKVTSENEEYIDLIKVASENEEDLRAFMNTLYHNLPALSNKTSDFLSLLEMKDPDSYAQMLHVLFVKETQMEQFVLYLVQKFPQFFPKKTQTQGKVFETDFIHIVTHFVVTLSTAPKGITDEKDKVQVVHPEPLQHPERETSKEQHIRELPEFKKSYDPGAVQKQSLKKIRSSKCKCKYCVVGQT